MNRQFKEAFDSIHITDEGKLVLVKRLAAGEKSRGFAPKRVLRTSLVAAVMACALLVTAGAIVLTTTGLQSYLGGGSVYSESVQRLDLSTTVDGYTVTLTDCVGDNNFLYIGMELTAPSETPCDLGQLRFDACEGKFSGMKAGGASNIFSVPDDDPADNKRRYVYWQYTEGAVSGQEITLNIWGLCHKAPGVVGAWSDIKVTDVRGPWTFGPFLLDYPERSVNLTPNAAVPLVGGTTNVTEVKITPLSAEVTVAGGEMVTLHTTGVEKDSCWGVCNKAVTMTLYGKDGEELDVPGLWQKSGSLWTEEWRLKVLFEFKQFVDLDEVGFIGVCGVKIPV